MVSMSVARSASCEASSVESRSAPRSSNSRAVTRTRRVRLAKQIGQELRDRGRLIGLGLRLVGCDERPGFRRERAIALDHDAGGPRDHEKGDQRGRRYRRAAPPHELCAPIGPRLRTGAHRPLLDHPADVVGQLFDRRIALIGHALEGHQRDGVEIADGIAARPVAAAA
jgi:hypothetical protein